MQRLVLVLALACPAVGSAGDCSDATLETVLARYAEARGGDSLEQQRALRIRSSYHEGDSHPTFDFRVMKPGYMRIAATYGVGDVYEEGFDGERAWEMPPGKPAGYVGGDAARALNQAAQSPIHLYGLHQMADIGGKSEYRGCAEIEGRNYYVVNVVSRFGTDIDYYVARDNFHVERARSTRPLHPTQDPTPITIEERWSDFREVGGVLHPFGYSQWNVATGERLSWLTIDSIEQDTEATPDTFAIPD